MKSIFSKRALVIAHEPDCPGGQVAVRLATRGFAVETHVVTPNLDAPNVATDFPDFSDYDLIAVMGSIRSLTNKDEIDSWVHNEIELLKMAKDADQPVLGICFGGQLIAEALGGTVESAPKTEIGWYEISPADGADNPVGPGPWMEWHHDRFTPPSCAQVLAITPDAVQLFRSGRMVGTQFHPEVDLTHVENWLATADDCYLDEYGQDRHEILQSMRANEARNTDQCHKLVDWYLDTIAFPEEMPSE